MSADAQVMLQPPAVKLALYAGDGSTIRVIVDNVMGVPIPLSGTVTAQIRASRGDGAVLQSFSVDLSSGAAGVVVLGITGTQTAALASSKDFVGVWDVQYTPSGGQPMTLVQGKCIVKQDVSRP
jgi:hypothetical protein